MQNDVNKWLVDILAAIDEIDAFIGSNKDFLVFKNDLKGRRAVERNVEIIGEAVNRVLQYKADIAITHARKIVDTRNYIIHGYDRVSPEIIWAIINRDLPQLKTQVEALLAV